MVDRARDMPPPELLQGLLDAVVRADMTMLDRQERAWSELGAGTGSSLPLPALAIQELRIACAYRVVPWWLRIWHAIQGRVPASPTYYELCARGAHGCVAIEVVVRRGSSGPLEVESSPLPGTDRNVPALPA